MKGEVDNVKFEATMYLVISKYLSALNKTSVSKEKASLHKNLIKAHELAAERQENTCMKMHHFDQMMHAATKAIYYGADHGIKWLANIVERGAQWDKLLQTLLKNETSKFKTEYLEKHFSKAN